MVGRLRQPLSGNAVRRVGCRGIFENGKAVKYCTTALRLWAGGRANESQGGGGWKKRMGGGEHGQNETGDWGPPTVACSEVQEGASAGGRQCVSWALQLRLSATQTAMDSWGEVQLESGPFARGHRNLFSNPPPPLSAEDSEARGANLCRCNGYSDQQNHRLNFRSRAGPPKGRWGKKFPKFLVYQPRSPHPRPGTN